MDGIDETRLKQRAFDIYKRGGERAAIAAEIAKLGITQSTLATWLYFFGLMVKFGRQTR